MADLYQKHNTGDDTHTDICGVYWKGQSFTPAIAHKITSVKLLLFKSAGSPGTVTVSIRETTSSVPSGIDKCSGTTDGDTLPTGSPYEWREITLGAGYDLVAEQEYAIVVRSAGACPANYLGWRIDSDTGYARGRASYSDNSGVDWTLYGAQYDYMFEDWGEAIAAGRSFGVIIG